MHVAAIFRWSGPGSLGASDRLYSHVTRLVWRLGFAGGAKLDVPRSVHGGRGRGRGSHLYFLAAGNGLPFTPLSFTGLLWLLLAWTALQCLAGLFEQRRLNVDGLVHVLCGCRG